jgi:hypothetical protein
VTKNGHNLRNKMSKIGVEKKMFLLKNDLLNEKKLSLVFDIENQLRKYNFGTF